MRNVQSSVLAALSLLGALVAGCASGPAVRVDQDPAVDLKAYQTFGFFDQMATDRAQYTTILTSRLKQATRVQLERHNYIYSDNNPDLQVNFFVNVVDRQEVRSSPVGRGFHGYRVWANDIDTVNYRQGTLSIDLVDAKRNELVWQGVAEGRLSQKSLKNPGPAVDQVVSEIFASFPINDRHGDLVSHASLR